MTTTPEYIDRYETLALSRTDSGVLTLRFHTDGGPAAFSGPMQRELPRALAEIAEDADNRVLVLTGTGSSFMTAIDPPSLGDLTRPAVWDGIIHRGRTTLQRLVDLEMPVIAAANGPVSIHSEWVLLADIAVVEESTVFSDSSHPDFGTVPGDGVALVWQEVLGVNRARALSFTGGSFTAQQALAWGAVHEVVPDGQAKARAAALAEEQAAKAATLTRAMAVVLRQRLSRRIAEGVQLGMAFEALAAADKAHQGS